MELWAMIRSIQYLCQNLYYPASGTAEHKPAFTIIQYNHHAPLDNSSLKDAPSFEKEMHQSITIF